MMETTPSPLDADARRFRRTIATLVRRFHLAERADVACCGMTVAQAGALETLARRDGLRASRLAAALGISPSTASRNLDRLEERGLLERRHDAADGRVTRVFLTDTGRRAAARVDGAEQDFAREILGHLGPDRSRPAVELLEELLGAVKAATERCCPGAFDEAAEEMEEMKESCCGTSQ